VSLLVASPASYNIRRASAIFLAITTGVIILFAVLSLGFFYLQQDIVSPCLALCLSELSDFDL
jgi:hypothetical protein